MPVGARLQRDGTVRRGHPRAELARLRHGPRGQLGSADAGREAEVVLDPARHAGLAAQHRALHHQRGQALRGAVDRRAEACRPAPHHDEVDLLAGSELGADAQRPPHLSPTGRPQLGAARQPHERQLLRRDPRDQLGQRGIGVVLGVAPRVREARTAHVLDHRAGRGRRPRPDDLDSDALVRLERLPARDEGREQHVAERAVLEEHRPQHVAVDGDVAHRLTRDRGEEHRLPGHQVELPEEAGRRRGARSRRPRRRGSPPRPRGSR